MIIPIISPPLLPGAEWECRLLDAPCPGLCAGNPSRPEPIGDALVEDVAHNIIACLSLEQRPDTQRIFIAEVNTAVQDAHHRVVDQHRPPKAVSKSIHC